MELSTSESHLIQGINMHLKARILLLFLATLTIPTFANTINDETSTPANCIVRRELSDGLYAGAQIGYDSYWMRQNFDIKYPTSMAGNPRMNAPGWVGGLLSGYGKYLWHTWYLGGEIFGEYSQANEKYYLTNDATRVVYSTSFDARSNFGFSLITGCRLNEIVMAYIRYGSTWATFYAKEEAGSVVDSKQNTVAGPHYGLGMEVLIDRGWSLRGEFTHTNNHSFTTAMGNNFDPSDNQVMVAGIYHFGV
jgi:opacity protein-like surface antigen